AQKAGNFGGFTANCTARNARAAGSRSLSLKALPMRRPTPRESELIAERGSLNDPPFGRNNRDATLLTGVLRRSGVYFLLRSTLVRGSFYAQAALAWMPCLRAGRAAGNASRGQTST